ncbi:unnamed protein product [Orchesella dallaii]|uniref:Essential protein Yae1 N-terminal domain-containing protein n=1 Tax=Orchesella dallaii TaxID=48710 RepID=A0ABP1QFB1_9HEXA
MESGDEDDAFTMGEREWQKMSRDLSKQGYRDGKNEGRETGMQESFGKAVNLALQHSMQLGQLHGLLEWKLSQPESKGQQDNIKRLMVRIGLHLNELEHCNVDSFSSGGKGEDLKTGLEKTIKDLVAEYLQLYPEHSDEVSAILGQN